MAYFVVSRIIGELVLATLLIGFVIQAFSEVHARTKEEEEERAKIERFVRNVEKRYAVESEEGHTEAIFGWFLEPKRLKLMKQLFDKLDIDGGGTLDVREAFSFYRLVLKQYFAMDFQGVVTSSGGNDEKLDEMDVRDMERINAVYQLFDKDGSRKSESKPSAFQYLKPMSHF